MVPMLSLALPAKGSVGDQLKLFPLQPFLLFGPSLGGALESQPVHERFLLRLRE